MANKTKAELDAENENLQTRIVLLERSKKKSAAQAQEIMSLRAALLEAEQRQAATAEILKVIASSPSDVQPVFDTIVESAMRLLGGQSSPVTRVIGDMVHLAAITSTGKEGDENLKARFPLPVAHPGSQHVISPVASFFVLHGRKIGELALKARLPLFANDLEPVKAGGLMSYSSDREDYYRRCAVMADKILKGVSPAEIPVEETDRFALVVNMKTAKALGITIPQSVLIRADEVVR